MQENTPTSPPEKPQESERWALIRDSAVLQVKLIVDGLRDFLLVPASLVATIMSLATTKDGRPGPHFYRLLALGKRSERVIDLFGAHRQEDEEVERADRFKDLNIDEIVVRVESFVVDEYRRGGMTAQAKDQIDKALDAIQRRGKKRAEPG